MLATLLLVLTLCAGSALGACSAHTDCVSCTNDKSWSGDPCRWCPNDNACHEKGSLLNPCSAQQNKVDPSQCGQVCNYDPSSAAGDYLAIAALGYAADAPTCANKTIGIPSGRYINIAQYSETIFLSQANLIGVVGLIIPDRKEIVIAFNGTAPGMQLFWEAFMTILIPKQDLNLVKGGTVEVQEYFLHAFTTLEPWVTAYLSKYWTPDLKLTFVGHSLGGAIASVAAIYYSPANPMPNWPAFWTTSPPRLYTMGMPRVGSYTYAKIHDQYVKDSWRITHKSDIVPHLPWCDGTVVEYVRFCTATPLNAGAPYHHGTEVWYNDISSKGFKICNGIPINEDKLCSNIYSAVAFTVDGIQNHRCYFERMVGDWCSSGSAASVCTN